MPGEEGGRRGLVGGPYLTINRYTKIMAAFVVWSVNKYYYKPDSVSRFLCFISDIFRVIVW